MSIKNEIEEIFKQAVPKTMQEDTVIRCVRFTKQMNEIGLLRNNQQEVSQFGGLKQLKLYAINY